jgi:hypothetical protein
LKEIERYAKEIILSYGQIDEIRLRLETDKFENDQQLQMAADQLFPIVRFGIELEANRLGHQQWPRGKSQGSFLWTVASSPIGFTLSGKYAFNSMKVPNDLFERNVYGDVLPVLIEGIGYYMLSGEDETTLDFLDYVRKPVESLTEGVRSGLSHLPGIRDIVNPESTRTRATTARTR